MSQKVCLFDLDDTLVSSQIYRIIYPTILKIIQKKKKLTIPQINAQARKWGLKKNKYGNYDSGDLCREFNLLKEYYTVLEKQIQKNSNLIKSTFKLLQKMRKENKTIGIISNSMPKTINLYLKKYKIKADFIFSQENAGCRKDNLLFWKKLIKKHHLNPQKCLVIGDDPIDDIKIPKKLKFKTFLIH